jgi:hypothetical protein
MEGFDCDICNSIASFGEKLKEKEMQIAAEYR